MKIIKFWVITKTTYIINTIIKRESKMMDFMKDIYNKSIRIAFESGCEYK